MTAFSVASGRPVTVLDVAEALSAASGIAPVVTGEYRLGDVRHVVASPERARAELGFTARVPPDEGTALLRLSACVLIEAHDEWQDSDRRYLSEESMALLNPPAPTVLEAPKTATTRTTRREIAATA